MMFEHENVGEKKNKIKKNSCNRFIRVFQTQTISLLTSNIENITP
jgi:hypothetical protein